MLDHRAGIGRGGYTEKLRPEPLQSQLFAEFRREKRGHRGGKAGRELGSDIAELVVDGILQGDREIQLPTIEHMIAGAGNDFGEVFGNRAQNGAAKQPLELAFALQKNIGKLRAEAAPEISGQIDGRLAVVVNPNAARDIGMQILDLEVVAAPGTTTGMCEPVACGHGDRLDLLEHVPGLLRPDDPFRVNTCKGTVGQHDRRLGVFDDLVDTAELAMRVEEAVAGRYRKLAIFATLVPRKGKPSPVSLWKSLTTRFGTNAPRPASTE
ncbi:hypothetical protein IT40_21965 [Paracoccus versutus]|nr:hypothetical protein IT40_21965 [Paracoccus versutus]